MVDYLIVFVFQFIFNIFKVFEIKHTTDHKIKELLMVTVWISGLALFSTYIAFNQLLLGNWIVIFFYLSGSVLGRWFAMSEIKILMFKTKKRKK